MDPNLERKRAQRYLYLKALYDRADGRTTVYVEHGDIGAQLGWDAGTTNQVVEYLVDNRLIKRLTFTKIMLTPEGVRQLEASLDQPDEGTRHFPPPNIIVINAQGDVIVGGDIIGHTKITGS